MQTLDLELRERLAKYLGDEITLQELYDWLTPQAWDVASRAGPRIADLFHEIDLLLSEYSHGDWDEGELKAQLAPFATSYVVRQGAAPSWDSTSDVNQVRILIAEDRFQGQFQVQTQFVDKQPAEAS